MATLPEGALELLIALQTPSPKGYRGVPVLVWGAPGVGKSTFIESLARPDYPVLTLIASLHDPTDFSGLPALVDGKLRFAPPEWLEVFERAQQGILFLDELTTAPPTVQAALLRLVLERKVGMHALPPEVSIAAAANPPDIAASGWELSPPLANRFVHLKWELPPEVYQRALETGAFEPAPQIQIDRAAHQAKLFYWRTVVAAFLRRSPQLQTTQPAEDEYAFASPRTWDYAIALMASCDLLGYAPRHDAPDRQTRPFVNLVHGAIGSGAATPFIKYLRELRIPDPEAVLRGEVKVDKGLREDELMTLFSAMTGLLLQALRQNAPHAHRYTLRYLEGALRVAEAGKPDAIYTILRQMVREGHFQQLARKHSEVAQQIRQLGRYYEGLVGFLESPRQASS
ncbi:MAG: MoxR family ATPase [Armatimonadota bacterium]